MHVDMVAEDIKRGMILDIYHATERFEVDKVKVGPEAVLIRDPNGTWRGLGLKEHVVLVGHFNPE